MELWHEPILWIGSISQEATLLFLRQYKMIICQLEAAITLGFRGPLISVRGLLALSNTFHFSLFGFYKHVHKLRCRSFKAAKLYAIFVSGTHFDTRGYAFISTITKWGQCPRNATNNRSHQ